MALPSHTKALTVNSISSPLDVSVELVPVANPPAPGSVAVRVLAAYASSHLVRFWNGTSTHLQFPLPFVPGSQAVGRVVAVGPDAASLTPGDLVFIDSYIRARDDPMGSQVLLGLHQGSTEATKRLMRDTWRDGVFKGIATVPLENAHRLDEAALFDTLGYTPAEVTVALARVAVAAGGASSIGLKAGQTLLVGPATGFYSGAIVEVATALGARVVAMGRSLEKLQPLVDGLAAAYPGSPRVRTALMTGDLAADVATLKELVPAGADAYIDISPPVAETPAHFSAALASLRPGAKVAIMGVLGDVKINYASLMFRNINIKGQYMYTREELHQVLRMLEAGVLRVGKHLGHEEPRSLSLEDWELLADTSEGWTKGVVFAPNDEA